METEHGKMSSLDQAECLRVLENSPIGHLGCFSHKEVYVVPITYVIDYPYIYSHSSNGKKIALMQKNPHVCLEVEEIHSLFEWKSVIAWGTFEQVKGEEATKAMRLLIQRVVKMNGEEHLSPLTVDFAAMLETAVIYRIHIKKITGRYEGNLQNFGLDANHERGTNDTF